jgi:hypothetical protein
METPYKLVKDYSIALYAGAKNKHNYIYRAIINMYEKKASGYLGSIYFHRHSETMPDADTQKADGAVHLHFPADVFPVVLDLLRNERPVYLNFIGEKWHIASLNTAREPVGEGELG